VWQVLKEDMKSFSSISRRLHQRETSTFFEEIEKAQSNKKIKKEKPLSYQVQLTQAYNLVLSKLLSFALNLSRV